MRKGALHPFTYLNFSQTHKISVEYVSNAYFSNFDCSSRPPDLSKPYPLNYHPGTQNLQISKENPNSPVLPDRVKAATSISSQISLYCLHKCTVGDLVRASHLALYAAWPFDRWTAAEGRGTGYTTKKNSILQPGSHVCRCTHTRLPARLARWQAAPAGKVQC